MMGPCRGTDAREGLQKLFRRSDTTVLNLIVLIELPICWSPTQDVAGMSVTNPVRSQSVAERALAELWNPSTVRY